MIIQESFLSLIKISNNNITIAVSTTNVKITVLCPDTASTAMKK